MSFGLASRFTPKIEYKSFEEANAERVVENALLPFGTVEKGA